MRVVLPLVTIVATWVTVRMVADEAAADVLPSTRAANAVKGVAFDGKDLPVADLRGVVGTHAGAAVDDHQLELDREAIATTLVARGYLAANATATVTSDRAHVVFDVDTGPLYRVRAIEVSGPAQRYEASVMFLAGEEASEDRIAQARRLLADTLARRTDGKIAVDVVLAVDPATATVDLDIASRITTIASARPITRISR